MDKVEKKKKKAKIQLLIFFIFIVFAFTFTKMLYIRSNRNVDTSDENVTYTIDNINKFDYDIKISVVENNVSSVYDYSGDINNRNGSIVTNKGAYVIVDGLYYNKKYEEVDNVFYSIDNKYLDISNIRSYLNMATLLDSRYEVTINDVIDNKMSSFIIYIEQISNDDQIIINIDYTNLVKLYNTDVTSYVVNYTLSNFG